MPRTYNTKLDAVLFEVINMSAIESMYNYLATGKRVTVRQAKTMFKVENVHDLVYRLRNLGTPVYTNRVKLSDGTKVFAYRIGTPSSSFVKNMNSRHVARARKTLYRDALIA